MPSAEYQREWKKKNPEKYKAGVLKYNKTEKAKRCHKRYNDKNKETRNADCREYYAINRESEIKRTAVYSKSKKGRLIKKVCDNKRRGAEGSFTVTDIKDLYATQGGRCYYCSVDIETGYHIDHMLPISRGGTNGPENLALACAPCNLSKHTKTAEEFMTCSV